MHNRRKGTQNEEYFESEDSVQSGQFVKAVGENLKKPLVVDPGMSKSGRGKNVDAGHLMSGQNMAAGGHVPPDVIGVPDRLPKPARRRGGGQPKQSFRRNVFGGRVINAH